MARMAREEVFSPDEIAIVHVMNRVVRRACLLGIDEFTGKNYEYRRLWIEELIERFANYFGIDVLVFAILSNHFHSVLRSRPDVVATWDDTEVARRWLMLCPIRKTSNGEPKEPTEAELNGIRNNPQMLQEIRSRLSDISWWMRLMCQRIGIKANREDETTGKFWEARFKAVRLLDEQALLACAAYVDLNPIRAAMAETLEESDFTSVQRRIQSQAGCPDADSWLAPLMIDERAAAMTSPTNPLPNSSGYRCSDLGFLPISLNEYLQLLDWTARQAVTGKRGQTPASVRPILERLSFDESTWCQLVQNFGQLFYNVAGRPQTIDDRRSRVRARRFHLTRAAREIFSPAA